MYYTNIGHTSKLIATVIWRIMIFFTTVKMADIPRWRITCFFTAYFVFALSKRENESNVENTISFVIHVIISFQSKNILHNMKSINYQKFKKENFSRCVLEAHLAQTFFQKKPDIYTFACNGALIKLINLRNLALRFCGKMQWLRTYVLVWIIWVTINHFLKNVQNGCRLNCEKSQVGWVVND